MKTKRPDIERFREKAPSDPAVDEEYETLDAYYKTQRRDRHAPGVSQGTRQYYSGSALWHYAGNKRLFMFNI